MATRVDTSQIWFSLGTKRRGREKKKGGGGGGGRVERGKQIDKHTEIKYDIERKWVKR